MSEPSPGESITVDGREMVFEGIPGAPWATYAEVGRKAKVYRLRESDGDKVFALKAFYPQFVKTNSRYGDVASSWLQRAFPDRSQRCSVGLSVADRVLISPAENSRLVNRYPQLSYAVLMEWIKGATWDQYVAGGTPLSKRQGRVWARTVTDVLGRLEDHGLAHCDTSGANIMLVDHDRVELIDIEDLFYPHREPPELLPAGTDGYVPTWVRRKGMWTEKADRIAGATVLCEMLVWHLRPCRKLKDGETFFQSTEFGKRTRRYRLMASALKTMDRRLVELFDAVWFADSVEQCPSFSTWREVLCGLEEREI